MENSSKTTFKNIFNTLIIISSIIAVTFYGISFISGAPDLTNKFLIYFGIFIVITVLTALIVWQISKFFKNW